MNKDIVSLEDYKSTEVEKSFVEHIYPDDFEKAGDRSHLIPIKKTVTSRGRTFQRIYWCKPVDAASFKATAPAVEFLLKTLETQKYFTDIVSNLEQYNQGLAAEIYNEMIKSGEQSVKIADKVVSVSQWNSQRETSIGTFLAGIKHLLNSKGSVNMADLTQVYEDVSYQYEHSGLDIIDEVAGKSIKKMSVMQDLIPMGWADKVKDVGAALRSNIKSGLETVRVLYRKLSKDNVPLQPEELDYRLKEHKGKLDELYVSYRQKRKLTDEEKLSTEGKKAKAPKLAVSLAGTKQIPVSELEDQLSTLKDKLIEQYGSWAKVPKEFKDRVRKFQTQLKEYK